MCRLGVWPKASERCRLHIDTIDGHGFERQIPRFCAIDRGKRSKACLAISAWPLQSRLGDFGRGVAGFDFLSQPGRLVSLRIAEKFIDGMQAGSREHPLITDMQILAADVSEEFDLMIAVWSKIRVTAFRREGFIARPVPEQDGFTQTGPRRNERNCLLCTGGVPGSG